MIAKSHIKSTLKELDKLYNKSASQKKAIYFSKLALIELCGWIEESFDDIVIKHANRNLKDPKNKKYYESIVKKHYGFDYEKNIRSMLIDLLGIINLENLEKKLEKTGQIDRLKTHLSNLKTVRNSAAHTYLKGITRRFDAPSSTINNFNEISAIIEKIDRTLRCK